MTGDMLRRCIWYRFYVCLTLGPKITLCTQLLVLRKTRKRWWQLLRWKKHIKGKFCRNIHNADKKNHPPWICMQICLVCTSEKMTINLFTNFANHANYLQLPFSSLHTTLLLASHEGCPHGHNFSMVERRFRWRWEDGRDWRYDGWWFRWRWNGTFSMVYLSVNSWLASKGSISTVLESLHRAGTSKGQLCVG